MGSAPKLAIACQGGGAHTAFTAGAVAYFFLAFEYFKKQPGGKEPFELIGMSGTSGGAITAAMAWADPDKRGSSWADGAVRALKYWNLNKADLDPTGKAPWWWGEFWTNTQNQLAAGFQNLMPRVEVPASTLLSELTRARMRSDMKTVLGLTNSEISDGFWGRKDVGFFAGAVDVLNPERRPHTAFKTFPRDGQPLKLDELLASACIPELFEAQPLSVSAGGGTTKTEYYWDGLYSQNPPLSPFFGRDKEADKKPDLIWVIQINPSQYSGDRPPATLSAIADRRNELAGNLSLGQELLSIDRFNDVANDVSALGLNMAQLSGTGLNKYKPVRVAYIELETDAGPCTQTLGNYALDHASKMNRDPAFIDALMAEGVAKAHKAAVSGELQCHRPARLDSGCHIPGAVPGPKSWPEPSKLARYIEHEPALAAQWARLVAEGPK